MSETSGVMLSLETVLAIDSLTRKLEASQAKLARVTAERDRLIEAWPERYGDTFEVEHDNGKWTAVRYDINDQPMRCFPTKAEAARFAAGLDTGEAEK